MRFASGGQLKHLRSGHLDHQFGLPIPPQPEHLFQYKISNPETCAGDVAWQYNIPFASVGISAPDALPV